MDLIEVWYHGLDNESWTRLFDWLTGRVVWLMSQYGKEPPAELDLQKFLNGEYSYVADARCDTGMVLSLTIIEEDMLEINVEKEEVQTAEQYQQFIDSVCEIAEAIGCTDYLICPEFKKDEAFFVNGKEI